MNEMPNQIDEKSIICVKFTTSCSICSNDFGIIQEKHNIFSDALQNMFIPMINLSQ